MAANLNEDDMMFVVLGERCCAGIFKCLIEVKGNYDYKHCHAERHGFSEWQGPTTAVEGKHAEWVLAIERADGSAFSYAPKL